MKKLLILGGSDLQVSLIKLAKELGHFVVTCDYLPNNPGHKFSHEYYNVSTTDFKRVLALAKKIKPDGILAYASDPAAPVAAWVCEKLGLPTNPYKSVEILSRKDKFREFMSEHGFLTPQAMCFTKYKDGLKFFNALKKKALIKPVDSSGSKGVFVIDTNSDFKSLFERAISFSRVGMVVIEVFVDRKGYQIGGDGFLVNGNLVFRCFGDIHFSKTNPLLPCSVSVPTMHSNVIVEKVHREIQKLLSKLGMIMGGLNFDILVDADENIHILEIGPRNGGNLIPELVEYCTGVDMRLYAIKSAFGENCDDLKMTYEKAFFSHYVVHSQVSGKLLGFEKTDTLKKHLLYEHYNIAIGQKVQKFINSSNRLGIFILQYKTKKEMVDIIYNMTDYFKITIDES